MPTALSPFTQSDYEIMKRQVVYQGVFRLACYELRFRLFDGSWSNVVIREVMERKSAVGILLYDPNIDRVILIEQFRPGAIANPQSPWLLEIVAGVFNVDEDPKTVALREAKEEANCDILDLIPIYDYFVSPGGSNEYFHLFCGRIDATHAGGIFGLAEENENIRAFALSVEEAWDLLKQNKIKTSPAIMSLQWLRLNQEWLKQLWQIK